MQEFDAQSWNFRQYFCQPQTKGSQNVFLVTLFGINVSMNLQVGSMDLSFQFS